MASTTYSFLDVLVTIGTPNGQIPLSGTGIAKEGVTVSYADDKSTVITGADGAWMTSLRAAKNGTVTIRLLKTSPSNYTLSDLYNYETMSSANTGNDMVTISNPVRGDTITCRGVSFRKRPDVIYAEDGAIMEWTFNAGAIDEVLGKGGV